MLSAPMLPATLNKRPRPEAQRPLRMVAYAQKLAKARNLALPPGYERDFGACRRFLDQHG
jgi:hypothetical protein